MFCIDKMSADGKCNHATCSISCQNDIKRTNLMSLPKSDNNRIIPSFENERDIFFKQKQIIKVHLRFAFEGGLLSRFIADSHVFKYSS